MEGLISYQHPVVFQTLNKQKNRKQNLISTDDLLTGHAFIGYTGISIFLVFPIGDWFIICYTLQGLLFVQNDYL
jgi:hypothetical protein